MIALYLAYGLNFTEYLRGEFAVVMYDEKKELDQSLQQIVHRGPDSCGNWISDDCRVGTLADFTDFSRGLSQCQELEY